MIQVSRAEVCAVACAELFRGAGEIMVSPMTSMVSIGARLARLTFAPDILLTDGGRNCSPTPLAIGAPGAVEGWMPFGRVFETLAWGRRHVVMAPTRLTGTETRTCRRSARCNTHPADVRVARPGEHHQSRTSYWVGNHSTRVFCDAVDVVSGIGWDKIDPG